MGTQLEPASQRTQKPHRYRLTRRLLGLLCGLTLSITACSGGSTSAPDQEQSSDESGETASSLKQEAEGFTAAEDRASDVDDTEGLEVSAGNELTIAIDDDGGGFSTTSALSGGSYRIMIAAVEFLAATAEDGMWAPALAESIVANEDATVWTITLREGVTFHDGAILDANAAKANLMAFKLSQTTGFAFGLVDSIDVVDDLTLDIQMKGPWPAFPYLLTAQAGMMISPVSIGSGDTIVGSGPFLLESWTPGDSARVVRNPDYWRNDGTPLLDAINFKVIPEPTARRAALEAGDVHMIVSPSTSDILDFLSMPEINMFTSTSGASENLILLNTTQAPLDDVRIRRAMAFAVDQQLIIDNFRAGVTTPAKSFLDPGDKFWVDTDYPGFDMAQAQALVAEYEAENGPAVVEFSIQNVSSTEEWAEVVASFWTEAGIEVTNSSLDVTASVSNVIADNFQAITWSQFGSNDPDGTYTFFHSSSGILNWTNFVDAQLDEGFQIGRENADFETRQAGYALVQERLASEVPVIWIDHLDGAQGVAALPIVHDILEVFLPDGTKLIGLSGGSFHAYGQIWLGDE